MKKLIHIEPVSNDELASAKMYTALDGYTKADEHPIVAFIKGDVHPISLSALMTEMISTENRLGRPAETIFAIASHPLVEYSLLTEPKVWVARLKNGAWLISDPQAVHLSLVKEEIEKLFEYVQLEKVILIPYYAFFAHILALFLESRDAELELEEIHTHLIPAIHTPIITAISQNTIRTNLRKSQLEEKHHHGDLVRLGIGENVSRQFVYQDISDDDKSQNLIMADDRGDMWSDPLLAFMIVDTIADLQVGDEIRVL